MAFISKDTLDKLNTELAHRKETLQPQLKEEYIKARDTGDGLHDNMILQVAKFDLERNNERILEIERIIRENPVLESHNISDTIDIGSTLELHDAVTNLIKTITLVDSVDITGARNPVSVESPLGKVLFGKRLADIAEFITPSGITKRFKIMKIF